MKIHEYQGKRLFLQYGINTTEGVVVSTLSRLRKSCSRLDGENGYVVKAQIHSGGRGKAGGVKFAKELNDLPEVASKILKKRLYTHQAGAEGKMVNKVLIERASVIKKEYYLSITIDNENAGYVIIASNEGGTEIEEVAAATPEKIIKMQIPYETGVQGYHAMYLAKQIDLPRNLYKSFTTMLTRMHKMFVAEDCSLLEINPLIINGDGELVALDAKVNFDDNALFRHEKIRKMRDAKEENPKELEASKYDLNYIQLEGNIGCMVNGAGLAMGTMDMIQACGGSPANFLDVGGSATSERISAAFKILLSDPNIRAIMINIFGGIMKCDVLAAGIVEAAKHQRVKVPIIVRMDGTNVEKGKEILETSGMQIRLATSMREAAELSVAAANTL